MARHACGHRSRDHDRHAACGRPRPGQNRASRNRPGRSAAGDVRNGFSVEKGRVQGGGGCPGRTDRQVGLWQTGPTHFGRRTGALLLDRSGPKPEAGRGSSSLDGGVGDASGLAEEFSGFSRTGYRQCGQSVPLGADWLPRGF